MNLIKKLFGKTTNKNYGGSINLFNNNTSRFTPSISMQDSANYYTGIISSCIDLRSKNCAKAKPVIYRWINQTDTYELNKHPFIELLKYPNEYMSGYSLIEQTFQSLDLMGNAYWYLPKNKLNMPQSIYLLPSIEMQVKADKQTGKPIGYIRRISGSNGTQVIEYGYDEIIHLKYPNPNNIYYGLSVIQKAANEISINLQQAQYQYNIYSNDAVPKMYLSTDNNISQEDLNRLKTIFGDEYSGVTNAGKVPILNGGFKLNTIQTTPKELDYIQSRKYSREEIMNIFQIPQGMLLSENVNKANAYASIMIFENNVIQPLLTLISSQISLYISKTFNSNLFINFIPAKTKDQEFEAKNIFEAAKLNIITINETRQYLGYDPLPNGNTFANTKPNNNTNNDTNETNHTNDTEDTNESNNDNTNPD